MIKPEGGLQKASFCDIVVFESTAANVNLVMGEACG